MKNNRDENSGRRPTRDSLQTTGKSTTASSLFGNKVYNNDHEQLGRIKDVLININSGRILSMIVEETGSAEAGQKYFNIELKLLTVDSEGHTFIIDQTRTEFRNNATFDAQRWPELALPLKYTAYTAEFSPATRPEPGGESN